MTTLAEIKRILAEEGCEPIRIQAKIATNQLVCTVCRGKCETTMRLLQGSHTPECYEAAMEACQCGQVKHGKKCLKNHPTLCTCNGVSVRPCQSCNATGFEPVKPELIEKACEALNSKLIPDLKQTDNVSTDGSQRQWVMRVVDDRKQVGAGQSIPPQIHQRQE